MSRKARRLKLAKEKRLGSRSSKKKTASFIECLISASICFFILLTDLFRGEIFLAYGAGMGTFTKIDSPVIFWCFIFMYLVAGLVLLSLLFRKKQ